MRKKILGVLLIITGLILHADSFSGGSNSSSAITQISKQALGAPTSSVTFSSISGNFTTLKIYINAASSTAAATDNVIMRVNGDSAANYNTQSLGSGSTTTTSTGTASTASPTPCGVSAASGVANASSICEITFTNYSTTTFLKEALAFNGLITTQAASGLNFSGEWWQWKSTAAIISITFTLTSAANFVTGSTFTLYGIN